jgi:hypothetical protein
MDVTDTIAGLDEHVGQDEGDLLTTGDEMQPFLRWKGGQQTVAFRGAAVELQDVFPVRRRNPACPTRVIVTRIPAPAWNIGRPLDRVSGCGDPFAASCVFAATMSVCYRTLGNRCNGAIIAPRRLEAGGRLHA